MKLVIFGRSISYSWGNGHAMLWRAVIKELAARGHHVVFFERDVPCSGRERDFSELPGGEFILYEKWSHVLMRAKGELSDADVALVESSCPACIAAVELVLESDALRVFYEVDAPGVIERYRAGEHLNNLPAQALSDFDLVLSSTGGYVLDALRHELGARFVAPFYGCVDPAIYAPLDGLPEYRADLSYIGSHAADRPAGFEEFFVDAARHLPRRRFISTGIELPENAGRLSNITSIRNLAPNEQPLLYGSSRWTLNVTRDDTIAMGHCPAVRLFEAAACGVPVITDEWRGLLEFFTPREEIVVVRTLEDVLDAMDMTDSERSRIAKNARERALTEHTAKHRVRELEVLLTLAADQIGEENTRLVAG